MSFQSYCRPRAGILLVLIFLVLHPPLRSDAQETEFPGQKLAAIFPTASKFVQRRVVLNSEKIAVIEEELGTKLQSKDLKPIFYIPISDQKKPMGLVLFVDAEGPHGSIEGAVGLDMRGKVVKVEVYAHNETDAIAGTEFLQQFIDMGIADVFKVGAGVAGISGHADASNAVARMPKKTLLMSYALFLKKRPRVDTEKTPEEEMPEVEDLKALMALMIDDYFVVVDYFDDKESKTDAIQAAKRLARYTKGISNFEPPKNADQTEEYGYLQDKFSETLLAFAEALEKEGSSDETRQQWDAIVELINQAHLRFSEEEIDLDTY